MEFSSACKKIKDLKIQGATNVAMAAVDALSSLVQKSKAKDRKKLWQEIDAGKRKLFETRATEPMMRNFLNYFTARLAGANEIKAMKADAKKVAAEVLLLKKAAKAEIARIGAERIENDSIVYTHCHSSTVVDILKEAARTKKFEVYNTETRPRLQGRITAAELAKAKIPVTHFVDSAAKYALKKADVMLIGADAITPTGIFNKVGSGLFAEVARKYDVPVYVCSVAWKFDPASIMGQEEAIESRNSKEVWDKPPKGVVVKNFAFEKINPELVSAIISELGVYQPETFVEEVKKKYPWMFSRQ